MADAHRAPSYLDSLGDMNGQGGYIVIVRLAVFVQFCARAGYFSRERLLYLSFYGYVDSMNRSSMTRLAHIHSTSLLTTFEA
jgi:hypothetical protein